MARDKHDDPWRRMRDREDEAEREAMEKMNNKLDKSLQNNSPGKSGPSSLNEKLDDLISKVDPLIHQIDSLYNMFMTGAETMPPLERRKQLDQLMAAIQSAPRSTPAALFRYNSVLYRYTTNRDRWDKLMRDLEAGKVRRTMTARSGTKKPRVA